MRTFCVALLVHEFPERVSALIEHFVNDSIPVVVHVDARSHGLFSHLSRLYDGHDLCMIMSDVACNWGDWSLVEAELELYRTALSHFPDSTHVHLMSGGDVPLVSNVELAAYLNSHTSTDFVELVPILEQKFVVDGPEIERLQYYYPFNYKRFRRLFNLVYKFQLALTKPRILPKSLVAHMGSQFKTLTMSSLVQLFEYLDQNPDVTKFFKSTWIPDESFIPTVVAGLRSAHVLTNDVSSSLTHRVFNEKGKPISIYPEHLPYLKRAGHKFVRKYAAEKAMSFDHLKSDVDTSPQCLNGDCTSSVSRPVHSPVFVIFDNSFDLQAKRQIDKYLGSSFAFGGVINGGFRFDQRYDELIDWQRLNIEQRECESWRAFLELATHDYFQSLAVRNGSDIYYGLPVDALLNRAIREYVMDNSSRRILLSSDVLNFEVCLLNSFAVRHEIELEVVNYER